MRRSPLSPCRLGQSSIRSSALAFPCAIAFPSCSVTTGIARVTSFTRRCSNSILITCAPCRAPSTHCTRAARGRRASFPTNPAAIYAPRSTISAGSRFSRAIVGAGDAKADKPDPAPILLALQELGAAPDRSVWYLGDTATDMQAARAAGITGVLVGDAAHDGGIDRAAPDLHFPDAHSWPPIFARLRERARLLD